MNERKHKHLLPHGDQILVCQLIPNAVIIYLAVDHSSFVGFPNVSSTHITKYPILRSLVMNLKNGPNRLLLPLSVMRSTFGYLWHLGEHHPTFSHLVFEFIQCGLNRLKTLRMTNTYYTHTAGFFFLIHWDMKWWLMKGIVVQAMLLSVIRKHNAKRFQFKTSCPFQPFPVAVVSAYWCHRVITSRETRASSRSSRNRDRVSGFSWLEMKME